jgi:rubrerythrin
MKNGYKVSTLLAISSLFLMMFTVFASAAPTKSINDLRKAYIGETTAHAKYLVYAGIAQKEGYRAAATLFRAAAQAESVHARNHKNALASYGIKNPKAGSFTAKPGNTRQNLMDAIKGETYEKNIMYPQMIKDAQAENATAAYTSFNFAIHAERQHAALYTQALKGLSKTMSHVVYYVCPVCGSTFQNSAPARCPVCGTAKERFMIIRES